MTGYIYEYLWFVLIVDVVVFGLDHEDLKVLLIECGVESFIGSWVLFGGFVNMDEILDNVVRCELVEEISL